MLIFSCRTWKLLLSGRSTMRASVKRTTFASCAPPGAAPVNEATATITVVTVRIHFALRSIGPVSLCRICRSVLPRIGHWPTTVILSRLEVKRSAVPTGTSDRPGMLNGGGCATSPGLPVTRDSGLKTRTSRDWTRSSIDRRRERSDKKSQLWYFSATPDSCPAPLSSVPYLAAAHDVGALSGVSTPSR